MKTLFKQVTKEEKAKILEMHSPEQKKTPIVISEDDPELDEPKGNGVADDDSCMAEDEMAPEKEQTPAEKIDAVVDEDPRFQNSINKIVDSLSDEEKEQLRSTLESLGISASSSAEEVHSVVSAPKEEEPVSELGEDDGQIDPVKKFKNKVADVLHSVGAGNVAAWGGVPAAIAIGATIGSVATGFAISWGATAVLMGLAKAMNPDIDKPMSDSKDNIRESKKKIKLTESQLNRLKKQLNEGNGSLDSDEFMFHCKRLVRAIEELKEAMRRGNTRAISEMKDAVQREFRRFKYSVEELESVLRRL